jgi:poly-gamma-glutamate synthesis protein (capsule biosynthesis protein)
MYRKSVVLLLSLFILFQFLFSSCTTTKKTTHIEEKNIDISLFNNELSENISVVENEPKVLSLLFSGDIMAHKVNFQMEDFDIAYTTIKPLLEEHDLNFANYETPINDTIPYSTFPNFNVHSEYAMASINAGFNVFTLANNHSNDQDLQGIISTKTFFDGLKTINVWNTGLHLTKKTNDTGISFDIIEKNGWKILFASYTEILNRYLASDYIDYYLPTEKHREKLIGDLQKIMKENTYDFFVLGVHSAEAEYSTYIPESRKAFFHKLIDLGVDIVWASHPHVTQEWELFQNSETGNIEKMIIYCLGNTYSGQRRPWPNLQEPEHYLESTGDSILLSLELEKKENLQKPYIKSCVPYIITTHIDSNYNFVIEYLSEDFINTQIHSLQVYYRKRLEVMSQIQGKIICK